MAAWFPRFACPRCGTALAGLGALGATAVDGAVPCGGCGDGFAHRGGVFQCLTGASAGSADAAADQYRRVRAGDGYRAADPQYYRMLPCVPADDPRAGEWRVRRASYASLQRHALPEAWREPLRVVDLGAGCGWLSHKLAALGHAVAAVDRLDDERDGLGACRHYPASFIAARADFDALPFEAGQFDLAVFNASLHYSDDPLTTLAEADRVLAPGGALVVMDSPLFRLESDGEAMVASELQRFARERGVPVPVPLGVGYLTFDLLGRAAARLRRTAGFVPSRGPWLWELRRQAARVRLRRAPAAFGVWIAR